jgi:hypothetical protein
VIDDPPSEEERREAEALARALDRGKVAPSGAEPPEDALVTAGLLRFGQTGAALSPERLRAVERRIVSALPGRARARRLWAAAGGLAAAAVIAAAVVLLQEPDGAALPTPNLALLLAQARASKGDAPAAQELEVAMRDHRARLFDALVRRYPEAR